ncbi:Predicted acetyltransferase [Alkalithermobacter thermoalcaliphilus JW-YL-7 = DSM 7308]|uniref:GCN5-related N-acetyltransferase n=1 Tax=Alkalithermobacter thermoalcaliphilus JW-YL-7 = DSM 7308 TaxID=1121328 RepID=A0A150FRX2_CLOPD|nr:GCN5-related N-acetyltransferase [[Clostridium] paradoxum JW-YL-7 = DSM 7308]SHK37752.1 Predicted acetyltransferase [[Clostridium] paradoxum JW-YL-7 = DSM 7308]
MVRLIKPDTSFKSEFLDMISEWKESGEELIPWSLNFNTTDFNEMVEKINGYSNGIGLKDGFVECSTYWLINENNKILGAIDIRHRLNEKLLYRGGHIGYGIRPSERKKGYATQMLSLALNICKTIGIPKVLITCDKNNIGSSKVILNNGGILDSEEIENGEVFQRYWIDLS